MKETIADSHIHDGHRQRMRSKLLSHGQRIFDTYELLEMLLYYVIPYKDTNPIAKRLLAAFGDLDGVLSASEEALCSVNGIGASAAGFLALVGAIPRLLGAEMLPSDEKNFADYSVLGEYLVEYFSTEEHNGVVALFFDNNMQLITIEKLYDVDFSSGGVKGGKFLDAAIRNRASLVVTAHSHPHGPFFPTRGDLVTNDVITDTLRMAGIFHPEHYIVCGDSYAGISSIKNFSHKFSQYPALETFANSKASAMARAGDNGELTKRGKGWLQGSGERNEQLANYLSALFAPISRDGKSAIDKAMKRYRTLEGTMTASVSELCEIEGTIFTCFIKLLAYVTSRRVTDKFNGGKKPLESVEIPRYLKALFLGVAVETAYLLTFDSAGRFIDATVIGEGTVNSTDVLPRRALEAALERSAKSVILAHNHPFGKPDASDDDVRLTNVMNKVFAACEVRLIGHYIVAGQRCNALIVRSE